ncbi:MAG: tetratricopeptide repeat protein, partial [Promethearchaeota archaeon]
DLGQTRSEILKQIDSAFAGVGMEEFIPDGTSSHENCIIELKNSKIVIFLLSSNYGSLIDKCQLKDECKADCIMKMGEGEGYRISYTHCEYKTTIAEGILHQTYKVLDGWDSQKRPEVKRFDEEFSKEMWTRIPDINDPTVVSLICKNLATKIVEWHTEDKLDFKQFIDREEALNEIIDNIDSKVEVWGVGGVGKTALIQVALLVQKLKGKKIVTIGTTKSYASGSGFEDFRTKCKIDQYITKSKNEIAIQDVLKALGKTKLLTNVEEILKMNRNEIMEVLSDFIRNEENFILFIDDFHLATKDVVEFAKAVDNVIFSSRKNTYIASKEIFITGIDKEDREDLIRLFSVNDLPEKVKKFIAQIAEGHPISTELLVKNYENIDFDKLIDFDLKEADDNQVSDFYNRVIEEIFSNNQQALTLLEDLAILNPDLTTNINKECILKSSQNKKTIFKALIDSSMLKKRAGKENIYEFHFKHIQDALEDRAPKISHNRAIKYYEKRIELLGDSLDDFLEILFHKSKINPNTYLLKDFLKYSENILFLIDYPNTQELRIYRLLEVGEELRKSLEDEEKAKIFNIFGNILSKLWWLEEKSEEFLIKAQNIYENLGKKQPDKYLPHIALVKENLLILQESLQYLMEEEELIKMYIDVLKFYQKLEKNKPEDYLHKVGIIHYNLAELYYLNDEDKLTEKNYLRALRIFEELSEANPSDFLPFIAKTRNNLGEIYTRIEKYKEGEVHLIEASKIYERLGEEHVKLPIPSIFTIQESISEFRFWNEEKNPLKNAAEVQTNLKKLYVEMKRENEAEKAIIKALNLKNKLLERNLKSSNYGYYLNYLAETQHEIGVFYFELERYKDAVRAYQKELRIRYELLDNFSENALNIGVNESYLISEILTVLRGLGASYTNLKNYKDLDNIIFEAFDLCKRWDRDIDYILMRDLASFVSLIERAYKGVKKIQDIEQIFLEELEIFIKWGEVDPSIFFNYINETIHRLGKFYSQFERFHDAEKAYLKELDLIKRCYESNHYLYYMADIQNLLGRVYYKLEKLEDTEKVFLEASGNYKAAHKLFKEKFYKLLPYKDQWDSDEIMEFRNIKQTYLHDILPKFAKHESDLGQFYIDLVKFEEAERSLLNALDIYKEAEDNLKAPLFNLFYNPIEIAGTKNNLGFVYLNLRRLEEADKIFSEILVNNPNYGLAWYNKSYLESKRNDRNKSVEFLIKAIEIDKKFNEMAKKDEVFDKIRDSEEFKELIGE